MGIVDSLLVQVGADPEEERALRLVRQSRIPLTAAASSFAQCTVLSVTRDPAEPSVI
jgi:hypothetical protein